MGNEKVALITGGASGIGLATAIALHESGNWTIAIIDFNHAAGESAAKTFGRASSFHQADVSDYPALSAAFQSAFQKHKRFDFVFANAGIVERFNFYAATTAAVHYTRDGQENGQEHAGHDNPAPPPPPLDLRVIDINLKSVLQTTHLAQHYFRLCKASVPSPSLVLTASTGALYATPQLPCYSAAKFGVFGLCVSVAPVMWAKDRIRVAAICPGSVRTNLLSGEEAGGWDSMPQEYFTKVERVAEIVVGLVRDGDVGDVGSEGVSGKGWARGRVVEICGSETHERGQQPYGDSKVEALMEALADVAVKEF